MANKKIQLVASPDDDEVAYLRLPGYSGLPGIVKKSVNLRDVIDDYKGPDLILDFMEDGTLVGVEILS